MVRFWVGSRFCIKVKFLYLSTCWDLALGFGLGFEIAVGFQYRGWHRGRTPKSGLTFKTGVGVMVEIQKMRSMSAFETRSGLVFDINVVVGFSNRGRDWVSR